MLNVRIESVAPAFESAPVLTSLIRLVTRTVAMGLMRGSPIDRLDAKAIGRVLDALQRGGLIGTQRTHLEGLLQPAKGKGGLPGDAGPALERLVDLLEESPVPTSEWPAMREVLGDVALSALLGISASSLRRYANDERATPPTVADRLHWVAMVIADLAGGYNDFGMRRWFERGRSQLGGRSPRGALGTRWSPGDPAALRIRTLAASLAGAGAT